MIKLQNNTLAREALPVFLLGLQTESLRDLTWTDPALGVSDCAWLPEVDQSPALQQYERYGAETLTLGDGVAISTRAVVPWSAAEIAADLIARKAPALTQIDADTDAINTAVMGSRAQEYELAEQHAQEYKAAGYTGPVPSSVQSWATAKTWTATQAADDILITAAQWRTAQAAIRAQRLLRKEQVRSAADVAGITAATAAWAGFVTAIRGQLGA